MLKGLYTAYTGMVNEQHRMDTLTNNLANSATVGFKKEGATSQSFDTVLAYKIKDTSESPNIAKNIGDMQLGVKVGENYTNYDQGSFKETGNSYDMALSGSGFFAVEFTNKAGEVSTKYTRDGSFTLTNEGYLVTKDGDYVLDEDGEHIQVDPTQETSIDHSGIISQNGKQIATLQVADFADYNYLEHYGENYYQPVEGAELTDTTDSAVYSGYLEQSNVEVVSEMVDMISVTRAYESSQKLIQTYDSSLDIAVNQLGKL